MIQVGLTLKSIRSQQVQTEHQNIRRPNAIDRSMLDTAVPTLSRRWHSGYRIGEGPSLDSSSLSGFKNDNDARLFGFVRPQARQGLIAPAGKADNLTSLNFFFRHFGRLQDIEATAIEKERMIPKQVVQFPDGGMVIGKYLGMELAQGLVYLCRV
jgi:hypothetical protein